MTNLFGKSSERGSIFDCTITCCKVANIRVAGQEFDTNPPVVVVVVVFPIHSFSTPTKYRVKKLAAASVHGFSIKRNN